MSLKYIYCTIYLFYIILNINFFEMSAESNFLETKITEGEIGLESDEIYKCFIISSNISHISKRSDIFMSTISDNIRSVCNCTSKKPMESANYCNLSYCKRNSLLQRKFIYSLIGSKNVLKSHPERVLCFDFAPENKTVFKNFELGMCITLIAKKENVSSDQRKKDVKVIKYTFKRRSLFHEIKCPKNLISFPVLNISFPVKNNLPKSFAPIPKQDSLMEKIKYSSTSVNKYKLPIYFRNTILKYNYKSAGKKLEISANLGRESDILAKVLGKVFDSSKSRHLLASSDGSRPNDHSAGNKIDLNLEKSRNKMFEKHTLLGRMKRNVEYLNDLQFLDTFEKDGSEKCNRNKKYCRKSKNYIKQISRRELDMIKVVENETDINGTDLYNANRTDVFGSNITATVRLLNENMTANFSSNETFREIIDPFARRGGNKKLYILGFFEFNNKSDCRDHPKTGLYEYKAAEFAIRQINERKIIDGYQLEMYYNDTRCDSGVAVDAFFHSLYRKPTMSVILGPGSSEVTERLARVVSRWNIVQMSYGATSPALSDRKNFPMFFRTVAPDSSHNAALLAFILHHKWYTVAVLHEQGDKHALPMTKLVTGLEQVNVTVAVTKGTSERDYKDHLQEIKVYHLEMHGAEYAWLIIGDKPESWWENDWDTECNDHQLTNAVQGVISIGSHYEAIGNGTSVSDITMPEILETIGEDIPAQSSGFVAQTYDAVWAIALALRNVENYWRAINSSMTLGDFTYDNHEMARDFVRSLSNLRFMGVSGPVSFSNSDRVGITAFHQRQGNELKLVTIYSPDVAELDFQCSGCSEIIWQGGSPPISSRNIIMRIAVLDQRVFMCVISLAVLGVIVALVFLSFNLYYRKKKFIKLSSPNLNNFVIVGCILVYIAVILLGMDHATLLSDNHFHIVCSARAFLLSGGFSLAFGCMFIKTYRVYHIFIRANTGIVKSKLLHDRQLLGMVSVLLLLDCVLVTLWVTIDPMERQLTHLSMQVNKDERNVVYLYLREHCSSSHMVKWLGTLYIYKGLLLVVGCYMAWETRHVKVPALNDSQYIGMSVYNVVITSIIVVALANVIPAERYTLTFVLVSTLIFVSTTTTLCILFVPKIHTILINPEDAGVVATPGVKVECKTRRFALDEPRESLYRAEILNRALKRELLELDEEYNRLAGKLGITPCTVRRSTIEEETQEEGSDDGLPPWISEYKDYSSTESGDVWYTSRPTLASAFSAIHHVALHLPSTSTSTDYQRTAFIKDVFKTRHLDNKTSNSPLRASLNTIDNHEEVPLMCSKAVRCFLSDRALNKLRAPPAHQETRFENDLTIPFRNIPVSDKEKLRSEPKLNYGLPPYIGMTNLQCITRSLNHVAPFGSSHSDFSKNTSETSNWTTAPLHDSTSFSTPPEDFLSSSGNGNGSSAHKSPDNYESNNTSNYISCDEENTSISTQSSSEIQSFRGTVFQNRSHELSQTVFNEPESSPFSKLHAQHNPISSSSSSSGSIGGATISDVPTGMFVDYWKESGATGNSSHDFSVSPQQMQQKEGSENTIQEQSCAYSLDTPVRDYIAIDISDFESTSRTGEDLPHMVKTPAVINNETDEPNIDETITISNSNACTSQNINNSGTNFSTHSTSSENNNFIELLNRAERIDNLRHQIFQLERELILLQLDQSEGIDL